MLKKPQIESLPEGFRCIAAITKPQIATLLEKGIIQMDRFQESLAEVIHENIRYIMRQNPGRKREIEQTREAKLTRLHTFVAEKNAYLADHPKADPAIAWRDIEEKIKRFTMDAWLHAVREERTIRLIVNGDALRETTFLVGCYVIEIDVPQERGPTRIPP